jgi:hypothetical protein
MIRLKNLLTESTTPDFGPVRYNLSVYVHRWRNANDKDREDAEPYFTLIDKAQLSLAKHYGSEWKNKIPKEMPIYANDRPILTQQVQIKSATKNWIRKVVTDVAPSLSYGDKWKLTVAWPFMEWEQIDEISSDILYGIEKSIVGSDAVYHSAHSDDQPSDAAELEKEWIQWGRRYLLKDRDFVKEMFDILVD